MLCIIALIASTFSTFSRVQNFILTLHSLAEKVELFFFWRKCITVVAVGVQTSFLLLQKLLRDILQRSA
jgi:hypothetical protein